MPIPSEVLELENRSIGRDGEPTLAEAYTLLKQEWNKGNRDREMALHLMFLSWYGLCEPVHITGFTTEEEVSEDLRHTFNEVHTFLEPSIPNDPEMLYVVGLMVYLFPYYLGDEREWLKRSEQYRQQYRRLAPGGIDPLVFENRGAYGDYFAGHARLEGGY